MKEGPASQPYFHISVVAQMLDIHPQTIRNYERRGLVEPSRTEGNVRLFSHNDIETIKKINTYTDIGVNLAGVEIILKLLEQREQIEDEMEQMRRKMEKKFQTQMERMRKEFEE